MTERELERSYRARFENRRRAVEELRELYAVVGEALDLQQAWLVAVARPAGTAGAAEPLTPEHAMDRVKAARARYLDSFASKVAPHDPLREIVGRVRPRPGLRSEVLTASNPNGPGVRVSLHTDGSVTLATRLGSQCIAKPKGEGVWTDPQDVFASQLEAAAAALAVLVEAQAVGGGWAAAVVDVRVGIEWDGAQPLQVFGSAPSDRPGEGGGYELPVYRPIDASWLLDAEAGLEREQVVALALDLVNQAGIRQVRYLQR